MLGDIAARQAVTSRWELMRRAPVTLIVSLHPT